VATFSSFLADLRNRWVRIKTNAAALYRQLSHRVHSKSLQKVSAALTAHPIRWRTAHLDLERASQWLRYGFTLLSIFIGAGLILFIAQLPTPRLESIPAKGVTLYSAHEAQQAYALFGSKPIELGAIQLRGVVITGKTTDGKDSGFVLLEIDGKASGPLGLGETAGKGMVVQALHADGATLAYQGQKIDLTLSKTTPNKTPATTKPNAASAPGSTPNLNPPTPAPKENPKPAT